VSCPELAEELQLRHVLRGVEAEDVMAANLLRIPPELALQEAIDDYFLRYDHGAFPVDEQARTIRLLTLRGGAGGPQGQGPTRRVRDLIVPLGDQVVVVGGRVPSSGVRGCPRHPDGRAHPAAASCFASSRSGWPSPSMTLTRVLANDSALM
jgi:hypothetical protein